MNKILGTTQLSQHLKEHIPIYTIKSLGEMNKIDVKAASLFSRLFHYLPQDKYTVNCVSATSIA